MNSLVTGANGFIGQRLCEQLRLNEENVVALLRRNIDGPWDSSYLCNLGVDTISPEMFVDVDTVYHLAAEVHDLSFSKAESVYSAVNVNATLDLLQKAFKLGVKRFIYVSSVKAAVDPSSECVSEEWDSVPESYYGYSKYTAEQKILEFSACNAIHVSIIRPVLVYGAGVKGNLHKMIALIDRSFFLSLPHIQNKRSMIHVDDLVAAILLVAREPKANGEIYIVSDKIDYSTSQIYECISKGLGQNPSKWSVPFWLLSVLALAGDVIEKLFNVHVLFTRRDLGKLFGSACYRSNKITRQLGWRPVITFYEAIPEIISEYKKQELL